MSEKMYKKISCDYEGCDEVTYLEETEVKISDYDGGYTRRVDFKYEEFPDGWTREPIIKSDLCPMHSKMFHDAIGPFMKGSE